jgi:hypothetical protein
MIKTHDVLRIKALWIALIMLATSPVVVAQTVPKQLVVEHFTNSRCSVCASQNPTFYATMAGFPNAIHIAYHPSSPYSNCFFSQQNPAENDARTNYYGLYGATPRAAVNGVAVPGTFGVVSASTLTTAQSEMTSFSMVVTQVMVATDSVSVRVVIRREDAASVLTTADLALVVTEDYVMFNAPNGESLHRDVFRKSVFPGFGSALSLPAVVGDSVVVTNGYRWDAAWMPTKLRVRAMLHNTSTKAHIQSAGTGQLDVTTLVSTVMDAGERVSLWPNPASDHVLIDGEAFDATEGRLLDISGKVVMRFDLTRARQRLDVAGVPAGMYIVQLISPTGVRAARLVIQR